VTLFLKLQVDGCSYWRDQSEFFCTGHQSHRFESLFQRARVRAEDLSTPGQDLQTFQPGHHLPLHRFCTFHAPLHPRKWSGMKWRILFESKLQFSNNFRLHRITAGLRRCRQRLIAKTSKSTLCLPWLSTVRPPLVPNSTGARKLLAL